MFSPIVPLEKVDLIREEYSCMVSLVCYLALHGML